jgi:hypothetical protein
MSSVVSGPLLVVRCSWFSPVETWLGAFGGEKGLNHQDTKPAPSNGLLTTDQGLRTTDKIGCNDGRILLQSTKAKHTVLIRETA